MISRVRPASDPGRVLPASRRSVLKAAVGLGVALPLMRRGVIDSAVSAQADPATERPQEGDGLVLTSAEKRRDALTTQSIPPGGPPVIAYPVDPTTRVVREGSRLNQVLLVHLDPRDLAEETRARAADGIVAYSAVCTHTGCDVWEWQADTKTIKCPCHFSVFDMKDGARVLEGPAPRRLPALPLKTVDGVLRVSGRFIGRPGFEQGGG